MVARRLPLALAAFRKGDAAEMFRQSKAIIASGDHRGLVLAVVASRLLGDIREEEFAVGGSKSDGEEHVSGDYGA